MASHDDKNRGEAISPKDLVDRMSTFDPETLAAPVENGSVAGAENNPGSAGKPEVDNTEQTRRDQKKSEFENNPERSRDDYLTHIGRGQQTHG